MPRSDTLSALTITQEIEQEHDFLLAQLGRLNTTLGTLPCQGDCEQQHPCSAELEKTCREILDDFSVALLGTMQQHFANEERHMKVGPDAHHIRVLFERHKEAHADLTQAVSSALFTDSTKEQRKSLSNTIASWLSEHIATHDQVLMDWLTSPAQ